MMKYAITREKHGWAVHPHDDGTRLWFPEKHDAEAWIDAMEGHGQTVCHYDGWALLLSLAAGVFVGFVLGVLVCSMGF
jgi:hypothetical protein